MLLSTQVLAVCNATIAVMNRFEPSAAERLGDISILMAMTCHSALFPLEFPTLAEVPAA